LRVIATTGRGGDGSSIGNIFNPTISALSRRIEEGNTAMKWRWTPRKISKGNENVLTGTRGGGRWRGRNAPLTAVSPGAPAGGMIQYASARSAKSILRRRAHGLRWPVARQI